MPIGKLAAQAGHAYTDSLMNCLDINPELVKKYRYNNEGSKVTIGAKNLDLLLKAKEKAEIFGLPHALIVDKNHILPPYFDGNPIITALGIGPCTKEEAKNIVKKFKCI